MTEHLDLSKLTDRQKKRLVLCMVSPARCGGLSYAPDGSRLWRAGGKWHTDAEWKAMEERERERRRAALAAFDASPE